jgi:hypothetical protein
MPIDPKIQAGAARVDETERAAAGLSAPEVGGDESLVGEPMPKTELADMTLSMFTQGASTRVRVGNPHNSSELYEYAFESADAANTAMVDAGILRRDQVADFGEPAGVGIVLSGVTVEQLEGAGLKRKGASTI